MSQLRVTKAEMWKKSYELIVKLPDLEVRAGPWVAEVELATGDSWKAHTGVLLKQSGNCGGEN